MGQSKICCQQNTLQMMSQEMREETAKQAVTVCTCVFAWQVKDLLCVVTYATQT